MATENYVDFSAATTVASGGRTSGATTLNVASTGSPFPSAGNFSVVITDQSTGAAKVILRVTAINSGSQWAVTPEGTDASANAGDNVYAVLSAAGLDGIRADCNQTGTRANLPSTTGQKAGNRYKCTDSPYEFIFDGTAWRPFIFGYRVDEPLSANFAWTNQGSSTITTTNGGILLKVPPNSGDSLRLQQLSTISAPYTCDIAFMANCYNQNFTDAGLVLYDSSGGKLVTFQTQNSNSNGPPLSLGTARWNSTTSFNASENFLNGASTIELFGSVGPLFWMRIYDDNTNRNFYFSMDGIVFNLVFQETRTNFLTPNKIGFFIDMNNTATSMWGALWAVHFNLYSGAPPTTGYSV
jgi:hypothetical protein